MYKTRLKKDYYDFSYKKWFGNDFPMTISKYTIRSKLDRYEGIIVGIFDKKEQIAEVVLKPRTWKEIKAYSVSHAYVKYSHQGQGLVKELYKGLISFYDLTIFSVGSHSHGARKTWLRVASDKKISSYGFYNDSYKYDRFVWKLKANKNKTELESYKGFRAIYGCDNTGIMLTKKNGKVDKIMKDFMTGSKNQKDIFGNKRFDNFDD